MVGSKCEDYDECTENPCLEDQRCLNTPGSFLCVSDDPCSSCSEYASCDGEKCTCQVGFIGDGMTCQPQAKAQNIDRQ